MARMTQLTPFVMVKDLNRSIRFFERVLGFACTFQADNYAFVRRDSVAMRLLEAETDCDLTDPKREQSCYIDVDGLDELYAELKPALDQLPEGRVREPFNQDYGQREFHVIDEDALLIFFGEAIK